MKTIALILGVLGVSFSGFAQEENNVKKGDLKGPAFKNYKVWMDKSEPVKIYSENNKKTLVGPAYKNQEPFRNTPKEDLVLVNTASTERQKLTGPAYKNFGPWTKNVK
ncbi:MAG: hypothetical protein KA215_04915 [Flavobacterium sp.]|jgi:hypothetical protein|nr:hypothetical protein [Flavobacterium sp.]